MGSLAVRNPTDCYRVGTNTRYLAYLPTHLKARFALNSGFFRIFNDLGFEIPFRKDHIHGQTVFPSLQDVMRFLMQTFNSRSQATSPFQGGMLSGRQCAESALAPCKSTARPNVH